MLFWSLLSGIVIIFFLSACNKDKITPEPEVVDDPLEAVWKLNKNVEGLKNLAAACVAADSVAIFSIQYNDDGSVLYRLNMKEEGDVELYSEIVTHRISIPELSMNKVGEDFFWTVNGSYLIDLNGNRIAVANESNPISFLLQEETVLCKVGDLVIGEYPFTKTEYLARDVALDYDVDQSLFKLLLSSGYSSMLSTVEGFRLLKENVLNQSFYKDVFLDAGIGLNSRKTLAAARFLNLSIESVCLSRSDATDEEISIQNEVLSGSKDDWNGRLLYPDGQPRYQLLFVNGGSASNHGRSLDNKGLENLRKFVQSGGSYLGTCAGAFFASNGYDNHYDFPFYLSIWPGIMRQTGLRNIYTGITIEDSSPLLDYYTFGGDHYVDSVRHSGGGFPLDLPSGTEVLARYDSPLINSIHNKPSIWAFKESGRSGRIVQCGSHPEEVSSGERMDLTAAMMQYAIEGRGIVSLKGYLKKGEPRIMDKGTLDYEPAFTRIGDLQTHHFAVYIPPSVRDITIELSSLSECDLTLMMNQETYAFPGFSDYVADEPGAKQKLQFSFIKEGLWYISVQCLTTVSVEETDYGQNYFGNIEVLNGVPYTISVDWK